MIRSFLKAATFSLAAFVGLAGSANAALVNWDIDSAASFVRLTIPDQTFNFDGTNVTARLRNGNDAAWSDAGGRMARMDGSIATNFNPGSSIEFLSGQHSAVALEATNLRPNPASFDPNVTNGDNPDGTYTNNSTAPAAFGAKVRATAVLLIFPVTLDVGFLAFRDVNYDFSSGVVALDGSGNYTGNQTDFGIASTNLDVDGVSNVAGQIVPDILNQPLTDIGSVNSGGGNVTYLFTDVNGDHYQLTYNINIAIAIDIDGIIVGGTAAGQVVAYGVVVPEASSLAMLGIATGIGGVVLRRRKRS